MFILIRPTTDTRMRAFLLLGLILVDRSSGSATDKAEGINYNSPKPLAALQKCLTEKLSGIGEVVAVEVDQHTTTLVLRDIPQGPMTIDLSPPFVTVTSKLVPHTRGLIEACL